jgi:hypothetical protein
MKNFRWAIFCVFSVVSVIDIFLVFNGAKIQPLSYAINTMFLIYYWGVNLLEQED